MKIPGLTFSWKRAIGIVLALIFYAIGPLTGGILFFIWPALGGNWW